MPCIALYLTSTSHQQTTGQDIDRNANQRSDLPTCIVQKQAPATNSNSRTYLHAMHRKRVCNTLQSNSSRITERTGSCNPSLDFIVLRARGGWWSLLPAARRGALPAIHSQNRWGQETRSVITAKRESGAERRQMMAALPEHGAERRQVECL